MIEYLLLIFKSADFIDAGVPSPIWHAVNWGHYEVVKILLEYNCDFRREAPDGTTPIIIAFLLGDQQIIDLFKRVYSEREFYHILDTFQERDINGK